MSTSLDAAQKAAAEVKAKLIAAGQLSNGKTNSSPQAGSMGTKSVRSAGAVTSTKSRLGLFHTEEVVINDVSMSARNYLTRTSTQEEITKISGASVSTRGRYLSAEEKAKLSPDAPSSERPLYLHIQGANEQDVKVAVGRVMHIILEHNHGNKTALSNGRGHSRFQGRGRFSHKFSSGPRFGGAKPECNSSFSNDAAGGVDKSQSRKSVHERLGPLLPNGAAMRPPGPLLDPNASADVRMRLGMPPYGAPPADANAKVSFLSAPAPLQREKVFLPELPGLTTAQVHAALAGENGSNLQFIREETGVDVVLKGSGSLDTLTSTLQPEALHFYLEHTDIVRFNEAKSLVVNLAQTVITDLQQQLLVQRQIRDQQVQLQHLAQNQIQQLQQQQQQQQDGQVQQQHQTVHAEQQVLQVQQHQLQQIQVQQVHHQQVQLVEQQVSQQHLMQQHLASDQSQQMPHVVLNPGTDQQQQASHVVLHQVQFQLPQPTSEQAQQQLNSAPHEIAYQFTMGSQTSAMSNASDTQDGRENPHGTAPTQISANFSSECPSISTDVPSSAASLTNSIGPQSQIQQAHEYQTPNKDSPARQGSQEHPHKESDQNALLPQNATPSVPAPSMSNGTVVSSHESSAAHPQSSNFTSSTNGVVSAVAHPIIYAVSTQNSETCPPPQASQPSVTVPYFVTIPSYPPPATSIALYDATQPPPPIAPSASYASMSASSTPYASSAAAHSSSQSVFYTAVPSAATYATPVAASHAATLYTTPATVTSTHRSVDSTSAVNSLATPVTASYNTPVGASYPPPTADLCAPPPAIVPPNAYLTPGPASYTASASSAAAAPASVLTSYAAASYGGPGPATFPEAVASSVPTVPSYAASYSPVVASYAPAAVSSTVLTSAENSTPAAPFAPHAEPSVTSDSSASTTARLTQVLAAQSNSLLASYHVNPATCQPSEATSHLVGASVTAQQPNATVASYSTPASSEVPVSSTTSLHQAPLQYHTNQESHEQTLLQQNSIASLSLFQLSHIPPPLSSVPHLASGDQSRNSDGNEPQRNAARPHEIGAQSQYMDSQQHQFQQDSRVLQPQAKDNDQSLQQEQHGYAQSIYQQQFFQNRQLEPPQEQHAYQQAGHDPVQFQQQQLPFENRPQSETTETGPHPQQNEAYDPSQPYQEHPLSSESQQPLDTVQHQPSDNVAVEQRSVHHQALPSAEQFGSEVSEYQQHANYDAQMGCRQEYSVQSQHQYQARPGDGSECKQREWQQQPPWDPSYQSQGLASPPKPVGGSGGAVAKAAPQRLVYDSGFSGIEAESAAHARQQLAVAELRQHPPPPPPPPPAPPAPRLDYHQPIINPEFSSRQGHSIHSNTGRSRCSAGPAARAGLPTPRGEGYQHRPADLNATGSLPPFSIPGGGNGQRCPPPDPSAENSTSRTDQKKPATAPAALGDAGAAHARRSNTVAFGLRRYGNYPFGSIGPIKRRRF